MPPRRGRARAGRLSVASAALVVLGIILVILGLLTAGDIVLVIIGLVSILAGGALQAVMMRRT